MKKITRKIIHYIGIAIRLPIGLMFLVSLVAVYITRFASCMVRAAYDEPDFMDPVTEIADVLYHLGDMTMNAVTD